MYVQNVQNRKHGMKRMFTTEIALLVMERIKTPVLAMS